MGLGLRVLLFQFWFGDARQTGCYGVHPRHGSVYVAALRTSGTRVFFFFPASRLSEVLLEDVS